MSAQNIEPYTDYYIWTDGRIDKNGTNIPPNNWVYFCQFYCFIDIALFKKKNFFKQTEFFCTTEASKIIEVNYA